ncbi:MAG TPA: hypothetical protein VMZ53_30245 [Kofleriaceae bacterium]|nr:hypothetical protein [Kofleriaceae bacterium]
MQRRMKAGAVVVVSLLLAVGRAYASDPGNSCEDEASELRQALTRESSRAETWNTVWRWTFTGAAVSSAAIAYVDFDFLHDSQAGIYVSAGKASIGAIARWIMPLHIHVPPPTADACADVEALHKEITRVAKKERGLFITGHIGGLLLNGVGGYVVYHYSGLGQAALSVGLGYPIGLLSNYTMPRSSWHRYRDREWDLPPPAPMPTLSVIPTRGGWFVSLGGAF